MFLNVLAFFVLRLLNSFSISDTEASVKANSSGTVILFLINMIIGRRVARNFEGRGGF